MGKYEVDKYLNACAAATKPPANKRMLSASFEEQAAKVSEEYAEYMMALTRLESEERQAEELIDLILASIGLLSKYDEYEVFDALNRVIEKGEERGDW